MLFRSVRVFTGLSASSSGRTIYDTAIINNGIDEAHAEFDPIFQAQNSFNRTETPAFDAGLGVIEAIRSDNYNLNAGVTKKTLTGATLNAGVITTPRTLRPGICARNRRTRTPA